MQEFVLCSVPNFVATQVGRNSSTGGTGVASAIAPVCFICTGFMPDLKLLDRPDQLIEASHSNVTDDAAAGQATNSGPISISSEMPMMLWSDMQEMIVSNQDMIAKEHIERLFGRLDTSESLDRARAESAQARMREDREAAEKLQSKQ